MIRIAVVGGGPKSLFALLALNDQLSNGPLKPVSVDVYDPLPPGSGSVWRLDQPEILRLNVNSAIVDASSSLNTANFSVWVARAAPEWAGEKYPPRVLVGRYLREQFLLLSGQDRMAVTHVPFAVTRIDRDRGSWRVGGEFGSHSYDEVLLATGHGLADAGLWEPPGRALNPHPLIGNYEALGMKSVPSGSDLWIRGAALTAYDVALLSTEGRGGTWQRLDGDLGDKKELRYDASGSEPRCITFHSRSGVLMEPKSETVPSAVVRCLEKSRNRLRQWGATVRSNAPDGEISLEGMWVLVLQCAQDCARVMGLSASPLALWRTALTGQSVAADGSASTAPELGKAKASFRNSLAVNGLDAPLTTGWLWARTWSGLYSELVAALDRLPRSTKDIQRFSRVARNLERFAFGPPEITARKLEALIDAGLLRVATNQEAPPPAAVVIDAVTPGPGALLGPSPTGVPNSELFALLLEAGEVSIRPGERGLLTAADGTCLAADGSRNESLAAVGRPLEDPTLGHDTLNRSLHQEHQLWAQRVATLITDQFNP